MNTSSKSELKKARKLRIFLLSVKAIFIIFMTIGISNPFGLESFTSPLILLIIKLYILVCYGFLWSSIFKNGALFTHRFLEAFGIIGLARTFVYLSIGTTIWWISLSGVGVFLDPFFPLRKNDSIISIAVIIANVISFFGFALFVRIVFNDLPSLEEQERGRDL